MPNLNELKEARNRVINFRDRYKEWAEKDDTDVNVKAINILIDSARDVIDGKLDDDFIPKNKIEPLGYYGSPSENKWILPDLKTVIDKLNEIIEEMNK